VSRDTLEARGNGSLELLEYVARQSVISLRTNARRHLPLELALSSAFQVRNVESDARGNAESRIAHIADRCTVLLWDLVDERHGCVRFGDGTYVTRSIELITNEVFSSYLADGEILSFGSDEHFFAWCLAADRFVEGLRSSGILERVLIVKVPWASEMEDGSPTPTSMGMTATEGNKAFERYYEHLQGLGLPSVSPSLALGDSRHRWGPAPFHYAQSVYEDLNEGIDRFLLGASI